MYVCVHIPGCPVVLCSEDTLTPEALEDLSLQKRQEICLSIFHCLNWFRELVSMGHHS